MAPDQYEDSLRDFLVAILFMRFGEEGTMEGEGKCTKFRIRKALGGGTCRGCAALDYTLPSGYKVTHENDILISLPTGKHIAIELKWVSSVSDQFKARSYDMLHMKHTFADQVCGILVYLHNPGQGISIQHARSISYPFDYFMGIEAGRPTDFTVWCPLIERITSVITQQAPSG